MKNWWASDTSLKDNAMEASDATDNFVRNHAGVSDQVHGKHPQPIWILLVHQRSYLRVQPPYFIVNFFKVVEIV